MSNLGILVHPFFAYPNLTKPEHAIVRDFRAREVVLDRYLTNLITYLRNPENTALVLEVKKNLELSQGVANLLEARANLVWVPTQKEKPMPIKGWKELYREIDCLNPSKLILMGGNYAKIPQTEEVIGCLAKVEEKLRERKYNLEVDLSITF